MPGKQRFPVPCSLIDEIATPQGQIYSHSEQKFVEMPKTAAVLGPTSEFLG